MFVKNIKISGNLCIYESNISVKIIHLFIICFSQVIHVPFQTKVLSVEALQEMLNFMYVDPNGVRLTLGLVINHSLFIQKYFDACLLLNIFVFSSSDDGHSTLVL